ncbi:unnamed protein product [Cylicocyclus nassatus]|uniref:Uncharacterized protein n=1 Tax=Cylicocyclus nassatus TaxID=53992 RepID=A0AA36HA84_CYLNA|nr:unnamed protein product [Cylicocyclus nassatus]
MTDDLQRRSEKVSDVLLPVEEMNKGPVDYAPRLAKISSQDQFDSLTEAKSTFYSGEKPHKGDVEIDTPHSTRSYCSSNNKYLPSVFAICVRDVILDI